MAAFGSSLAAWCGWGMMEAKGQDPLWVIGNQQVHFPQEPGLDPDVSLIRSTALPSPDAPEVTNAYKYQGQIAQRTQNIQHDDEGHVLFFEVDGSIYNRDGFLIADTRQEDGDTECNQCFVGGWQVHFIPVPGSCRLFYIVGVHHDGFERDIMAGSQLKVDWGVLDIGQRNINPNYQDLCSPVMGGMVPISDVYGALQMQANAGPTFPVDNATGIPVFETARVGPQDIFSQEFVYSAAIRVDAQGRHLMAITGNSKVHLLEFNAQGFRAIPQHWSLPVASRLTQRGEAALHFDGTELKVAYSCYRPTYANMPCSTHVTEAVLYRFLVNLSTPIQVTLAPAAPGQINPWPYALDMYCRTDPDPLDYAGNAIEYPAIAGLEFSPSGDFLYFVKSPSFPYPSPYVAQPDGPPTTFGCINLNWTTANAGSPRIYLPIGDEETTRSLCDTQLDINTAPNGMDQALYMVGADAQGEYWLGAFLDPDNPSPSTAAFLWKRNLLDFGQVASLVEPETPNLEHRLLNRRVYNSNHQTFMQQEFCCEDLTLAKDRSTTITTDCDLTWEPGDNAFWNTNEPIHVATELRIEAGAHVVAQNMTFKFAEDAKLTIEPGASFKCTNCLFTNACPDKRWYGIQALTTPGQHQFGNPHPTYQSELVLRASIVEHASIGIRTGGGVLNLAASTLLVDDDGNDETPPIEVWTRTIIRNCHQGVMMRSYSNFLPGSGAGANNLSRFDDVLFSVDQDYMPDYAFKEHVYLWKVSGIPFAACTFENLKADAFFAENGQYPGSAYLGHGIRSLDANFRVFGKCGQLWPTGGPPCPENIYTRSTFTGLDHGIHALQGSKLRNFTVDRAQFTDNIAGVYADGVVGYVVKNSNFSVGNRNVAMTNLDEQYWFNHHRGIYSKRCYGFTVDDNTLYKSPGSPNDRKTEGVVIGYSGDHNDYVFRNHGRDLSIGFVGEGQCASTAAGEAARTGLQMICNTNDNNAKNLSSRRANGQDLEEQVNYTIRTNQGDFWRQADNEFDGWPQGLFNFKDFEATTQPSVSYWHQGSTLPWRPLSYDPALNPAQLLWPTLANNCASKIPSTTPTGPGMVLQDMQDYLEAEKLAYGNIRYLYQQLIDGGNTDEVVDEITAAWPQDAWDLRDYLLSKSPYLSYSVLKELNIQNKLPQTLFAQVCIANPEATKSDGFYNWLENEAPYPLSESLLAAIVASWDVRTFRSTLEAQMAGHHAAMSQAANVMLEHLTNDEEAFDIPALRGVWQEIRTPAARYAEALSLLDEGDFYNATAIVTAIPTEHDLKAPEAIERQRMLDVIAFLATVANDGRSEDELTVAEQDALEALVDGQQDRPASWAQNILCFHYNRCVAPWTGEGGEPKSLPKPRKELPVTTQALSLHPNPTANWAVAKVRLSSEDATATLRVLDVSGKQVATYRLSGKEPQLGMDTRMLGTGAYLVEVFVGQERIANEKLIVQP